MDDGDEVADRQAEDEDDEEEEDDDDEEGDGDSHVELDDEDDDDDEDEEGQYAESAQPLFDGNSDLLLLHLADVDF